MRKTFDLPEFWNGVPVPRDMPVLGFNVVRRMPYAARLDPAASDLARGDRASRHDRAACPVISARVFFFFPSFFHSSSHTFSLYTAKPSCFSTLLPPSPLKSSPLFLNFQTQIVYFLNKFASPTSQLLQFAQFHSTHLSLSLSKT